jgi:hypothetical protein
MKKIFKLMFVVTILATSVTAIEPGNFGGFSISFYAGSSGASYFPQTEWNSLP